MARPQSEKVWLVSDLHRSQTLPNIFHHRPPPPPIARLPPPTPSTNIDFPPSAISSLSHHSIPLSTAYHRVSRDPLATARDRPRPLSLSPISSLSLLPLAHSLILLSRRYTHIEPGVTRHRHISFSYSTRSWRWSRNRPAFASASRSTNSGIMTGLIGERGFAPASSWK